MFKALANNMRGVVSLEEHLRRARKARWKGKTKADKSAAAKAASQAFWDALLSPEERSAEMKRRALKRKRRKR